MIIDKFGQQIFNEKDLCGLYLTDPSIKLNNVLVDQAIEFPFDLDIKNKPLTKEYIKSDISVTEFDTIQQSNWYMPDEYKTFDIATWILDQCSDQAELQRAGEELILYQERELFMMLRYLKYLVDTMRTNNIVWGTGRGSSVSSFVLFLMGVHKVNSLYYDLSITEFLK